MTFNQQEAGTPDGNKKLLEENPWLKNMRVVQNPAVGKNFAYCSDACEIAGVDASGAGRLFGTSPAVPLVVDYGSSPITQNFTGTMTFFNLARTVSIADKNKSEPEGIELLKTSPRSFTVPNLKTNEVRYDPAKDQAGPLSLGVAAERHNGPGDNSKSARLVVIGNSAFATNQWEGLQRNGDLFLNTINWLDQN